MNNFQAVLAHYQSQPSRAGERARSAAQLHGALYAGDIDRSAYEELMHDLKRIDTVNMAADELTDAIAVNEIIDALMAIPLP